MNQIQLFLTKECFLTQNVIVIVIFLSFRCILGPQNLFLPCVPRSSQQTCSLKNGVLKNSSAGVFLRILGNFYRTPPVATSLFLNTSITTIGLLLFTPKCRISGRVFLAGHALWYSKDRFFTKGKALKNICTTVLTIRLFLKENMWKMLQFCLFCSIDNQKTLKDLRSKYFSHRFQKSLFTVGLY